MNGAATYQVPQAEQQAAPTRLIRIMAVAAAIAVANIYYNQPMLAEMARSFHVSAHEIGFVATATQVGYAAGMPLFIPLGDVVERRALVSGLFVVVAACLSAAALSPNLTALVFTSFLIGLTSVMAQILIPLASDMVPPSAAGRTVGTMLSGVILGILLARTLSGTVSQHYGWRAMYFLAAGMALVSALMLRFALPYMPKRADTAYRDVMRSIAAVLRDTPKLRQVAVVAGMFFAAFSAFWTTLVFLLEGPPYHYGGQAAGLFGLVGAVGASVAPIAGRLSDRRSPRFVVSIALAIMLASYAILWGFGLQLVGLIVGIILLDAGAQAAQVANQTRVMALRPDARNRVNTIYMIGYFMGGSLGSLVGSYMWSRWHWAGVCASGIGFMIIAWAVLISRGPDTRKNPT
jgi:predicted MFS family arabinose efflux permease